jgi:hypothetical protein
MVKPKVNPAVLVALTSGTQTCSGDSVTFTATPTDGGTSPSYQWKVNGVAKGTNSRTFSSTTLSKSDSVKCVLISNAACASPDTVSSNTIAANVLPKPTVTVPSVQPVCSGDSIKVPKFNGTVAGSTFKWTNADTAIGLAASGNGDITAFIGKNKTASTHSSLITVTPSANGCTGVPDTFSIAVYAAPAIIQSGFNLMSSASSGNHWYHNGVEIPGATEQTYTVTENGSYSVVTDEWGCSSEKVIIKTLDVAQLSDNFSISAFPNPSDGNFTVSFYAPTKSTYYIEVRNVLGEIVYNETVLSFLGKYSKLITVQAFGQGVYTIYLNNSDGETYKKMIVR